MIDIGNWTICKDNCSPMSTIVLQDELQPEEIRAIKELLGDPKLSTNKTEDGSFSSCWVNYVDKTSWLYNRIHKLFEYTNNAFQFSDLMMIEKIIYMEFENEDELKYHTDINMGVPFSSRRLSMYINLSTSDEYRGGQLEFLTGDEPYPVSRSIGTAIVSPSYLLRRVNKVTEGKKKMLVAWISSPNYKQN